ncbi:MAG TPA: family 1 encapsulin nanocompartment shell protein [Candidatus Bathyarchaeia archaeon]|nr:family 1 encapsulin nanocompartment shell protein [Candidatus Bathyarchaeia archaeon]
MDDLLRGLAPITPAAWGEIDAMAKRVLRVNLAGRKLVDFQGPRGWGKASVKVGRVDPLPAPMKGVDGKLRRVQPLVELRSDFELSRAELDNVARGARDPDLEALVEAATRIARAEDTAIFHGYKAAGIRGIIDSSPHKPLPISEDYQAYPGLVAEAERMLRQSGIDGPFAIALGPRCYSGLMQATRGGYPLFELVRRMLEGPVVWAPAVDGAVVVSAEGGDFQLTVGSDLSIGYASHDAEKVRLYFVESLTFQVFTPEAAVVLSYS